MRVVLALFLAMMGWLGSPSGALAQQPAPTEAELQAKGAKRLAGKDFEARYVGNTLTGRAADGDGFHLFFESPTAYRMEFQGKRTTERWRVGKDGEFCSVADGSEACTREYEYEGTIYSFNEDGTLAGSARIRQGNPEKL